MIRVIIRPSGTKACKIVKLSGNRGCNRPKTMPEDHRQLRQIQNHFRHFSLELNTALETDIWLKKSLTNLDGSAPRCPKLIPNYVE